MRLFGLSLWNTFIYGLKAFSAVHSVGNNLQNKNHDGLLQNDMQNVPYFISIEHYPNSSDELILPYNRYSRETLKLMRPKVGQNNDIHKLPSKEHVIVNIDGDGMPIEDLRDLPLEHCLEFINSFFRIVNDTVETHCMEDNLNQCIQTYNIVAYLQDNVNIDDDIVNKAIPRLKRAAKTKTTSSDLKEIVDNANIEQSVVFIAKKDNLKFHECLKENINWSDAVNRKYIKISQAAGSITILEATTFMEGKYNKEMVVCLAQKEMNETAVLFKGLIFNTKNLLTKPLDNLIHGYDLMYAQINSLNPDDHYTTKSCLKVKGKIKKLEPGFAVQVINCDLDNKSEILKQDNPLILDIGKDGFATTNSSGFDLLDQCIYEYYTINTFFYINSNASNYTKETLLDGLDSLTITPFKLRTACGDKWVIEYFDLWSREIQQRYNLSEDDTKKINYGVRTEFFRYTEDALTLVPEEEPRSKALWFWNKYGEPITIGLASSLITSGFTAIIMCMRKRCNETPPPPPPKYNDLKSNGDAEAAVGLLLNSEKINYSQMNGDKDLSQLIMKYPYKLPTSNTYVLPDKSYYSINSRDSEDETYVTGTDLSISTLDL